MRRLLALLALFLLVGCGGTAATLAPYAGQRTNGYPSPGQFSLVTEVGGSKYLAVQGARKAVADSFAAAWQADGWKVAGRREVYPSTLVTFERAGVRHELAFIEGNQGNTFVAIPPP